MTRWAVVITMAAAALWVGSPDLGHTDVAGAGPGVEVNLRARDQRSFPATNAVVDSLIGDSVLRVNASGFPSNSTGSIAQCRPVADGPPRCRDPFPVRFDQVGNARIQYLATAAVGDVFCGPSAGCAVVIAGPDASTLASVFTVFGGTAPPRGQVRVEPRTGIRDGQTVDVMLEGYPPLSPLTAMLCAAPAVEGLERCGAPGPVAHLQADSAGRASKSFPVRAGRVGREGRPCGYGAPCGITAVAIGLPTTVAVVPITYSAGAGYDPARLLVGIGLALALGAVALRSIRSTDWREPSEAATPDLDATLL